MQCFSVPLEGPNGKFPPGIEPYKHSFIISGAPEQFDQSKACLGCVVA